MRALYFAALYRRCVPEEGAYQTKETAYRDWCLLKSRTILHTNVKGLRRGGAAGLVNTVYQGELLAFGALGPSKS